MNDNEFRFDEEVKERVERGDFDTPAEKMMRRFIQKPELLDRLMESLQEEPVPWEDDNEDNVPVP